MERRWYCKEHNAQAKETQIQLLNICKLVFDDIPTWKLDLVRELIRARYD